MSNRYCIRLSSEAYEDIFYRSRYLMEIQGYSSLEVDARLNKSINGLEYFPSAFINTGKSYKGDKVYHKVSNRNIIIYAVDEINHAVYILRILSESTQWYKYISKFKNS